MRLSRLYILNLLVLALLLGSCMDRVGVRLRDQQAGNRPYQAMDFQGWDLRHVQFVEADLHGVNFQGANLAGADLRGADLKKADFRGADLRQADVRGANLARAEFFEADLRGAKLGKSDWRGTDFRGWDLTGTSFKGAQLNEADFTEADLNGADLSQADLRFTTFDYAILKGVRFKKSNLSGMDFSHRNLEGADFSGADLRGAKFHYANLKGAKFEGANLVGTDLTRANLLQTDFKAAVIEKTRFEGARMKAPQFPRAQITRVAFTGLDLKRANFKGAWLKGISFKGIDLSGSDFSYATLEDTLLLESKLTNANLTSTDFSQALLFRTDFTGVRFKHALFPQITEPQTGMVFVQAPMGCYTMGDVLDEGLGFDAPPHQVCLGDFFIAQKEVTQAQFELMMGYNPSFHESSKGNLPVENLSHQEAQRFIAVFSQASGFKLRLPTEAEWEYACRDLGAPARFGNGKDRANPKEIAFNARLTTARQRRLLKDDGPIHQEGLAWKEPVPVGLFGANNLGLFDFSGNVAEMVADQWDPKAYSKTTRTNPLVEDGTVSAQVVRGGHFDSGAADIRCAKRSFMTAQEMDRRVGLRLVREITEEDLKDRQRFELQEAR